jgi:hypothetical protein
VVKLRDDKICHEHDSVSVSVRKYCPAGWCTIFCCPFCGLEKFSAGPVDCPHKKNENGTLRWYRYPDMRKKTHVAAKENAMRKQKRSKRR